MLFPILTEISRSREMTTVFGGYNHQISCQEGQFLDMKNMTSKYFPMLSPRNKRGFVKKFDKLQGILDKEDLWWVDNGLLYKNNERIYLNNVTLSDSPKTIAKMGGYVVIMPDKVWINTATSEYSPEHGYIEQKNEIVNGTPAVEFSLADVYGAVIEYHDSEYYEENKPKDGDYLLTVNSQGKPSLKVYSVSTAIWMAVTTPYIQIKSKGIGIGFEKEDGIKIVSDTVKGLEDVLVNTEEVDGKTLYTTNTYIIDKTDDTITVPGIFSSNLQEDYKEINLTVSREVPKMAYITECNNRLWGCSTDGHEVYCSKLGDVKNWNCFRGVSTDSWAATIGSDGKFTGAVNYLGYPIFFKEDSLIKIAISATGGHQLKETKCRGVQSGSEKSIAVLNEVLYYKSNNCVCVYNGSLPYSISDIFGDVNYYDAVAGAIGDKYYISLRDANDKYSMFAYDSRNSIWCKEDDAQAKFFVLHKDDLYYVDKLTNIMKSVNGTLLYNLPEKKTEDEIEWFAESGPIGYSSPENKYVGRINLRITLEFGTQVDFFIEYDSSGVWEHKFGMSGKGTKTFSVPIIPRRCDHFRYKISGKGGCKIHSITKTVEGGSED